MRDVVYFIFEAPNYLLTPSLLLTPFSMRRTRPRQNSHFLSVSAIGVTQSQQCESLDDSSHRNLTLIAEGLDADSKVMKQAMW